MKSFSHLELLEPPKIDLETTERRGFQPTEVRIETTDVSCGPDVRFDFPQKHRHLYST